MDPISFEQMSVDPGLLGAQRPFLTNGMEVTLQFHEGRPLSGALPALRPTIGEPIKRSAVFDPGRAGQAAAGGMGPSAEY